MQYYYFITGLPNLGLDDSKLTYTPTEFLADAKLHLSQTDYRLMELLHIPAEVTHLLSLWYPEQARPVGESLYPEGFYEEFQAYLKQKLDNPATRMPEQFAGLPDYFETLGLELTGAEELPSFARTDHKFMVEFYQQAWKNSNEFIRKWFRLNADIQNILIAISGRRHEHAYADYLIGESDLTEKLAKSQASDFGLGKEYPVYEAIWRIYDQNNILYRERGYDVYRWKWIEDQNFFEYFSIDRILGYYCKLRILARWTTLDTEAGKSVFYEALTGLENSFSFPEEYAIKSK
ncbi:MAG TPA: DUF2764 family protein [Candidatus Cloacimonadota bacterium]|nr:DUF2764 family protein [Candidatus Cloacimonadota bacterium]